MSINADLRDKMLDLYEQHKSCGEAFYDCSVGRDFMEYMEEWINQ